VWTEWNYTLPADEDFDINYVALQTRLQGALDNINATPEPVTLALLGLHQDEDTPLPVGGYVVGGLAVTFPGGMVSQVGTGEGFLHDPSGLPAPGLPYLWVLQDVLAGITVVHPGAFGSQPQGLCRARSE